LISCINFFWIVTIQIQTRHVRGCIGKENITISLIEWKIIMFDHEGIKTTKVMWSLSLLFLQVKSKKLVTKKIMRLKGLTCIIPINLWLLKIYSKNFLKEFWMWFFLQDLVYLRLIFKIGFFGAKTRLQKELSKNINY